MSERIKRMEVEKEKELLDQKLMFLKRETEREFDFMRRRHDQEIQELKFRH